MGRVLIIGGSAGLTGAVVLAAEAALRAGAGLVTCAVPAALSTILEIKTTEAMTLPLADGGDGILSPVSLHGLVERLETVDAVVLGPGLGRAAKTTAFLRALFPRLLGPTVIDADALWHAAELRDALTSGHARRVFTPHGGEFARLLDALDLPNRDRQETAQRFCDRVPGTLALKGPGTVVCDADQLTVNPTGNPGMATGGTGDVLAGIIGAFLARGDRSGDAARRGVYLHGAAGDLAAAAIGEESLIASDVTDALPSAILGFQESLALRENDRERRP